MLEQKPHRVVVCLLCLASYVLCHSSTILAQDGTIDEKVIQRYKKMLKRNPKEGNAFDRLYQLYLEGAGLEAMIADYEAEAQASPDALNAQLVLGHIYKRVGKDVETIAAYQRAAELAPNDYYPHFALGQMYAVLRRHGDAIAELSKAAELSEASQSVAPNELTKIYKSLGRAYFRRDMVDEAIEAWTRISELDTQNIFSRLELADLFREQELYEQAIAQHQAITEIKKDNAYRVCLSLREIGKIHEEMGEFQQAIESYDAAIALTAPGNWLRKDLRQRVVGIYAADSDWEGLIAYYQAKIETSPNDPEIIGLLASAYMENQQPDEGIVEYRKGLALAPTDIGLRLNLIAALRSAEKFGDAAAEYEALSEQQSDDFGIYRELGELYLQLDDEEKARATYQRMTDHDPENAGTRLILAEIYAGHEWVDDAVAEYEMAVSLAPDNPDFIEYFGEFYLRQGDRAKTLETWNRMVEGDKSVAANYHRLAQLLDAKEFRAEAIAASKKAVELNPDSFQYREELANRLMENKDYEQALAEYTEAANLAPNEFFAERMDDRRIELYRRQGTLVEKIDELEAKLAEPDVSAATAFEGQKQLVKMYFKLGNTSYAVEVLTKARTLNSSDISVNRWLAEVYAQQGRSDEANAIYYHLIEIDGANAREYYTDIARIHLNMMDSDAATEAAKQVVLHSPRNPEGYRLLSEISKQLGNYESAADYLKQAVRLRPEATDIRAELAEIYKLAGNPRQAIDQYWRCWELSESVDNKLGFVKSLSEAYYDLGRGNELEEKLKQMSKISPSDTSPILALAAVYRLRSDLPGAQFQLARALEGEHENPDLLAELVRISLDLGDTQDALSYQQRLVKAQPEPFHQQRLGELLFDAGREQEAIQVWTKLLHARSQSLEAEVKLAALLIRHGLIQEALSALDRAGGKAKDAKTIYQVGAALVQMNELDRARPHFVRILEMPKPVDKPAKGGKATANQTASGLPGTGSRNLNLARNLVWNVQGQRSSGSGQPWIPNSFEETQAAALVQLATIAQQKRELAEFVRKFEEDADANPRDIQKLELLVQIYVLTENNDKVQGITDRLIAASPSDPVYQDMRLTQLMRQNAEYGTFKKHLDGMTAIKPEVRLSHIAQFSKRLYTRGQKEEAARMLGELDTTNVTDLNTGATLIDAFAQQGKFDVAENILAQLSVPKTARQPSGMRAPSIPQQQWWRYRNIYQSLATAYVRDGNIEKGVDVLWTFFERTKPVLANARRVASLSYAQYSYSGYTPLQSTYPSPTTYYNQLRLEYLQQVFLQLWTKNQQETFYTKLRADLETAEGRDRIYPSLALSYCHWWEGKRGQAQEILSKLQNDNPEDLTLKINAVFVSIQTGDHAIALQLLDELARSDPRNRRQYYNLTLQLAALTGNTIKVRELMSKVLNSPSGVRELYEFSKKLQQSGMTQFAIAAAKKVMTLSMSQRDPNFLMELSQHLEELGRGRDAASVAERALRFANQRDRHGQTLHSWNFQRATHLVSRSKAAREREPQLLEAARKNPDSFQAQARLAAFYDSTNQINKASAAFEAALKLRPKDGRTRQRYAQMLQRSGKADEALTQFKTLLEENPNALGHNTWEVIQTFFEAGKVEELVSLAKVMIAPSFGRNYGNDFARNAAYQCTQNNNPKAAAEIYEQIIKAQPNQHHMYADLASAYAASGEREKAIQFLREKLESDGASVSQNSYAQAQMVSKLIELYKASDSVESYAAEYEAKLSEDPSDSTLLYLVASLKIAANQLDESDPLVSQLLNDTSMLVNPELIKVLADAYRSANDREREIRLLETATEKLDARIWWNLSEVYQKLGEAYFRQDEKEKARNTLRKMGAITLLQNRGGGHWEKERVATTYMQHEMWDDAETVLTEIINDLSAQRWNREQAQQQLMQIKQRRDGLTTTTRLAEKAGELNIGTQRSLAGQYMQQNQLKKAAEIYNQIVKVMPEDLESRAQLATIYSRQNQHSEAIDAWNALLEVDPENTKYQDGLVNALQSADKFAEALELAQEYIDQESDNGVHYIRLARVYAAGDRVDDALKIYKKAVELAPGNGEVYGELAQLYLRKDDLDSAEEAFKEAVQYTGQEWERREIERQLTQIYRRQGKLEEMLKKAEEEGTLTMEMLQERARGFRNEGKLEKAVEAYKKALDMTAQSWEKDNIYNELVMVYVQLGENDLAIEVSEELSRSASRGTSISHGPSGFKVMLGGDQARETLITAYKNDGKLEQLKTHYEDRLKTESDNPALLEMVAEIYRNANQHQQAAEAYQSLSKAQPSNVRSFYHSAAAFNRSRNPDMSKAMLNQGEVALSASHQKNDMWYLAALATICADGEMYAPAIKLVHDAIAESARYGGGGWGQEEMYGLLGNCFLGAERYEEAVDAYQQMANVARQDWTRQKAETAIHRAYRAGNLYEKQILERLKKVEENPDDPDARFALAQSYEWNDMHTDAIDHYRKLSELQPDEARWHKTIGDLYQKQPEGTETLAKAAEAYRKAVEIEPDSYAHYTLLASVLAKGDRLPEALAVYRQALEAPLEKSEHDSALAGIWSLYADKSKYDEGIAILEEFRTSMAARPNVHELLGDAYRKTDNVEKSDAAYTEWLRLRQKEVNGTQRPWEYVNLAQRLLDKNIMPEKALELAERGSQIGGNWYHASTVARAYVANGRYEEALEQFKISMNNMTQPGTNFAQAAHWMWRHVAQAGKNASDEERFLEMVENLKNAGSHTLVNQLHADLALAQYYREHDQPDKVLDYMNRTGFIAESAWSVIGPFDNKSGISYNVAHIPENAAQIDTGTQFPGVGGQVGWEKRDDGSFDGYVDFNKIFKGNSARATAYAWTSVASPDERGVHLRFGSDDQAKVWLNGEEIFTQANIDTDIHSEPQGIDRHIVPFTLKAGENSILVKVCNETSSWGFHLRITNTDGKPLPDLELTENSTSK